MNVLALGAVVGITGVASVEAITQAVMEEVPAGTQELNGRGAGSRVWLWTRRSGQRQKSSLGPRSVGSRP